MAQSFGGRVVAVGFSCKKMCHVTEAPPDRLGVFSCRFDSPHVNLFHFPLFECASSSANTSQTSHLENMPGSCWRQRAQDWAPTNSSLTRLPTVTRFTSILGRPTHYFVDFTGKLSEGGPIWGRGAVTVLFLFHLEFDGWMIDCSGVLITLFIWLYIHICMSVLFLNYLL